MLSTDIASNTTQGKRISNMRLRKVLAIAAILTGIEVPCLLAGDSDVAADANAANQPGESEAFERPATFDDLPTGEPNEAWTIPQPRALKSLGIKTFGWLEQGATFNSLSPSDRWNGPVATNDRSNEYEMNQMWLGFERAIDTHDGGGFDVGGRVDLCYGSDWRYGDSVGLETAFENQDQLYGLVLPQFYGTVGYNDLTVKIGHYAACMGYEVVPAPANFFYSHSYALCYSEPILVTGLEADYRLSDHWNVIGGFNRGWQVFDNGDSNLNFLGGVKWHNDATKTSVSYMLTTGPQDDSGNTNRFSYALVLQQHLTEKLLYVAQHDLGCAEGADPYTGGYANWYGLNQYLIYQLNEKWAVGGRVEWFRDEDGGAVAGIGNLNKGWMGKPGFQGTFTETTLGLNYRPTRNLLVRPEARWDCYSGSTNINGELPFGDGERSSQFLFATDVVFTF